MRPAPPAEAPAPNEDDLDLEARGNFFDELGEFVDGERAKDLRGKYGPKDAPADDPSAAPEGDEPIPGVEPSADEAPDGAPGEDADIDPEALSPEALEALLASLANGGSSDGA